MDELSAGFEDEPEPLLTLPEDERPDDLELLTEEPSDFVRLCPLETLPEEPDERVPPELRVTPDPLDGWELPDRTAGEGLREVPDPLLTLEEPDRDVAPDRITDDPEELDRLVALRLTALRISSLLRSREPLLLAERRVLIPKSDCAFCADNPALTGFLLPDRAALLNPVERGP